MMAPPSDDFSSIYEWRRDFKGWVSQAKAYYIPRTASTSKAKIEAICENGLRKISPEELHRLKQIWPYTDTLIDSDDFSDYRYTGVAPRRPTAVPDLPCCSSMDQTPADQRENFKALIATTKVPDWCLSCKVRHDVMKLLAGMENCRF